MKLFETAYFLSFSSIISDISVTIVLILINCEVLYLVHMEHEITWRKFQHFIVATLTMCIKRQELAYVCRL